MTGEASVSIESDPQEPISVGVVRAVAVLENASPMELLPLSRVIDPEALDALVESSPVAPGRIEFHYCGYEVTVRDGEYVTVVDPEGD